ncbi:hypothetical protein B5F78_16045, partial [Bacteroides sp. An279]
MKSVHAKIIQKSEMQDKSLETVLNLSCADLEGRVNQRVQHYEIFLKKTSAGVEKLSFSLGLALIFFL